MSGDAMLSSCSEYVASLPIRSVQLSRNPVINLSNTGNVGDILLFSIRDRVEAGSPESMLASASDRAAFSDYSRLSWPILAVSSFPVASLLHATHPVFWALLFCTIRYRH